LGFSNKAEEEEDSGAAIGEGAQGTRALSETLRIFCHKSLEFQVSYIGAVQEDGFCL